MDISNEERPAPSELDSELDTAASTQDASSTERNWVCTLVTAVVAAVVGAGVAIAVLLVSSGTDLPSNGSAAVPRTVNQVMDTVVRVDAAETGRFPAEGIGSGVVLSSDGYIITNAHVIDGVDDLEVRFVDGDIVPADVVGMDMLSDIAVLQVERSDLVALPVRDPDEPVRVGETVIAVGAPFGLDLSVSVGVVSARDREIPVNGPSDRGDRTISVIPGALQTDAAINPGNSGGPLVDLQGRLVGINTAIVSDSGVSAGVGFAVGAAQVMHATEQLLTFGTVMYPQLGLSGTDLAASAVEALGLRSRRGALVMEVTAGGAADNAGIVPDDVIVAVDDEPIGDMAALLAAVRMRDAGDAVAIELVRDGERKDVTAVLDGQFGS